MKEGSDDLVHSKKIKIISKPKYLKLTTKVKKIYEGVKKPIDQRNSISCASIQDNDYEQIAKVVNGNKTRAYIWY